MGLEAATYINQLNAANPVGAVDPKSQGDDHLRLIKSTLQATFPNITGAMTATHIALNNIAAAAVAPTNKVKATGAAGAGTSTNPALRSDSQLLLDVADTYAWTGQHSWTVHLRALDGTDGAPAFSFTGDTDTGIYRFGTNAIGISAGALLRAGWDGSTSFINRNQMWNLNGTLANPAYSFESDTDTGLYRTGADDVGIVAAGVRQMGISNTRIFLGQHLRGIDGVVGTPSYTFDNDPNTGIYSGGADILSFSVGGVGGAYVRLVGGVGGLYLRDGNVTNPGLTFDNDTNTGLYFRAADRFAFSEGGVGYDVGYRNIPQNSQSANYGLVQADSGKHVLHPNGGGAGDTFTIPANASVTYDIGTVLTFVNRDSNALSIAITSDTMILAGTASTGTRSLAQNGIATAIKVENTVWLISGTGLS